WRVGRQRLHCNAGCAQLQRENARCKGCSSAPNGTTDVKKAVSRRFGEAFWLTLLRSVAKRGYFPAASSSLCLESVKLFVDDSRSAGPSAGAPGLGRAAAATTVAVNGRSNLPTRVQLW